jgi:hypothetical protein
MTIVDVLTVCHHRGVRLVISDGVMRAQGKPGAVNESLREGLAAHKDEIVEAYGDGVIPDPTLPAVLRIPAWCLNSLSAVKSCVDSQRVGDRVSQG